VTCYGQRRRDFCHLYCLYTYVEQTQFDSNGEKENGKKAGLEPTQQKNFFVYYLFYLDAKEKVPFPFS
jgi:hypothetical protein